MPMLTYLNMNLTMYCTCTGVQEDRPTHQSSVLYSVHVYCTMFMYKQSCGAALFSAAPAPTLLK